MSYARWYVVADSVQKGAPLWFSLFFRESVDNPDKLTIQSMHWSLIKEGYGFTPARLHGNKIMLRSLTKK
jgi:hypothetical protein